MSACSRRDILSVGGMIVTAILSIGVCIAGIYLVMNSQQLSGVGLLTSVVTLWTPSPAQLRKYVTKRDNSSDSKTLSSSVSTDD